MPWRWGRAVAAVALVAAACSDSETTGDDQRSTSSTATVGDAAGASSTAPESTDDASVRAAVELLPDSAVGRALGPFLTAILDGTLTESMVEESLTDVFLEQIDAVTFVATAQQLPALLGTSPVVTDLQTRTEYHLSGTMLNPLDGSTWTFVAGVEVETPHRFVTFGVAPPQPPVGDSSLTSLDDVRAAWGELGADSQLVIKELDSDGTEAGCGTGGEGLAVGSAFKFYVLGAVASAVEAGRLAWTDDVVIDDRYRSLPSGQLQVEPAGATLSVVETAELMMAISDNTATDHLMGLVGRDAVEAELELLGNTSPERNRPFLTTADLFRLKLGDPIRLGLYGAAGEAERREMLAALESEPLPPLEEGDLATPTALDVEWFASAGDLCRAIVALDDRGRSQPEIRRALQAGGGLPLDPEKWPAVSFKGGSEPGVLSLTWLVARNDSRRFVVSGVVNDPDTAIDDGRSLSIMTRAFELLAEQ